MFWKRKKPTYDEERAYVVKTLSEFLNGTGGDWDWGDFLDIRIDYPDLDAVRGFCLGLPTDHPPAEKRSYCSEEGLAALRKKLEDLER